jgi:Tol biopolymer transport system component
MLERFGPWSSALDDGLSPRLSTFWKRRLALLASARAARAGLSRRDWLKLGAVGAAAGALPTLHLASADGPGGTEPAATGKIYVRAAFWVGEGRQKADVGIFAIDPATSARVQVLEYRNGPAPSLSPDGRTFAVWHAGWAVPDRAIDNQGVWTIAAGGQGEMRRIADFGGKPTWSPDSRQLIVARWLSKPDGGIRCENWRFDVDGSGAAKLPIPETDAVEGWSPDGRWLVTVSERRPPHGRGNQLYLMRPDGTEQRLLTEGIGLNVHPQFSPDGRRIAYTHQDYGGNSIWVVNIDGSGRHRVIQEENDVFPEYSCWSPDGQALACNLMQWQRDEQNRKFLGGPESHPPQLVIVDAEGTTRRSLNLPRALFFDSPDWR